jgi:hypothetical protein
MTLSSDSLPPGSHRDEAEVTALHGAEPFHVGRFVVWCRTATFTQNVGLIHEPKMRSKTP